MDFIADIKRHAKREFPKEACGFLLTREDGLLEIKPEQNIALNPLTDFEISVKAYLAAKETHRLVGVYHSHPDQEMPVTFTEDDVASITSSGLIGYLYHVGADTIDYYKALTAIRELRDRQFFFGYHDCFTLAADYYQLKFRIALPYFPRTFKELAEGSLVNFNAYAEKAKLVRVPNAEKPGDILCMSVASGGRVNHVAIYTGSGKIIHQLQRQLSREENYTDYWKRHTVLIYRHESKL